MYPRKMIVNLLLVLLVGVFFVGCSNPINIFESFVSPSDGEGVEGMEASLEKAETPEDYIKILNNADVILASSANAEEKQKAMVYKAEAILGKNNIQPTQIFQKIAEAAENENKVGEDDNVFSLIEEVLVENDAPSSDIRAAADLLNQAANSESSTTLNASDETNRGIMNSMYALQLITQQYDVDKNGAEKKDDEVTNKASLTSIVNPDGDSGTNDGIGYYVANAESALENGGVTEKEDGSVKQETDNIFNVVKNIEQMTNASNGDGSFTYSGKSIDESSGDEDLGEALDWIINNS